MRFTLLILIFIQLTLYANNPTLCVEFTNTKHKIKGQTPPVNMMIKSLEGIEFPKHIVKTSKRFSKIINVETLLKEEIDLVILWNSKGNYSKVSRKLNSVGIDTCYLNLDSIYDYEKSYLVLGELLNKNKKALRLSSYIKDQLKLIETAANKIPNNKRVSIYYAKRADGLTTVCKDSTHSEVITLVGAKNVIDCKRGKKSNLQIDFERLFVLNPEIIITDNKEFYKKIFEQKKYRALQAVDKKRVFFIPNKPINYLDKPPSFLKILGALWLAKMVYKDYYNYSYEEKKEEFFRLFLRNKSEI